MKGQCMMTNLIIIAILIIVVGVSIWYIVKEKKKGTVCIGCAHAGTCASKKDSNSGCGCQ